MSSNQVAGYSVTEAREIAVSAIFAQLNTRNWKAIGINQIHEAISEMLGYGNQSTVAVQYMHSITDDARREKRFMNLIREELRDRQQRQAWLEANS